MLLAYKYRIYPNRDQEEKLAKTLNTCRILYNLMLAERRDKYGNDGRSPSFYEQKRGLVNAKNTSHYLQDVHSQVLQDVALRIERTFNAFFDRARKKKEGKWNGKVGYPRFKGRNQYDSFTYPQYGNGCKLTTGKLFLSKIGAIRIVQHRPIEGTVKTCTIRRDVDRWYACFPVEIPLTVVKTRHPKNPVGVDVGLKSLITLNNGEKIEPPKYLRKMQKRLRREQRRLSRKKKESNNQDKQRIKVARVHRKVRLQRTDFNHKLSHTLVNRFDLIAFERLSIRNMIRNHHLAKSIADASWHQLQTFTSYKAEYAGKNVRFAESRDTTTECSRCGFPVPKNLSERMHLCPNCELMKDRDWNSAVNILNRLGWDTPESTPAKIEPIPLPQKRGGKFGH